MTYRQAFVKTFRAVSGQDTSTNAQLLRRAGLVDQTMAGVYSLLPLGLRVVRKIEAIVRREMAAAGAVEVLLPALHPKRIWEENGRWELLGDIMYQFKDNSGADVGLGTTHEEVVVDIARSRLKSYRDLPLALFQIQSKFRNEPRARSGILRTREFIMKDLYSFHATVDDLNSFYDRLKESYLKIFRQVGLTDVRLVEASGGTFTKEYSHEFQVPAEVGEDRIFFCSKGDWAQNQEIATVEEGQACPNGCGGTIASTAAIEVGNIFRFFDKYGLEMKMTYQDADGRVQPVLLCSYGIGITRLLGAVAELCHDDKGLVWPLPVAPAAIAVVAADAHADRAAAIYHDLLGRGADVIWDDRPGLTLGEKLTDADLIGFPFRVAVGAKSTGTEQLEVTTRAAGRQTTMTPAELVRAAAA